MKIQPDNDTESLVVTWDCSIVKRVPIFVGPSVTKRGSGVRGAVEHVAAEWDAHRMPRKNQPDTGCVACMMGNVTVDGPYYDGPSGDAFERETALSLRGVTDLTREFAGIGA